MERTDAGPGALSLSTAKFGFDEECGRRFERPGGRFITDCHLLPKSLSLARADLRFFFGHVTLIFNSQFSIFNSQFSIHRIVAFLNYSPNSLSTNPNGLKIYLQQSRIVTQLAQKGRNNFVVPKYKLRQMINAN